MAKTRRARIDTENGHRRVTRPHLRIIEAEMQGYLTNHLRAPSGTIEYDCGSREVGYDEAIIAPRALERRAAVGRECVRSAPRAGWPAVIFGQESARKPHTHL